MVPNFLGIGVHKAGSTWLYELLKSHPEIWVPPQRREVRFLTRIPDRTLSWYKQFFPPDGAEGYMAVGEVTPHYFYCDPEQISFLRREIPSAKKFILILRHPVDRVYSHYWFRRRVANVDVSFSEYVEQNEGILETSSYVDPLRRWLRHFDRECFLILLFEEDLPAPDRTKEKLSHFLEVSPSAFPEGAGETKQNERYVPVLRGLYSWATHVAERLRKQDMDWLIHVSKKLGVKHLFGRQKVEREAMDPELRSALKGQLLEQVDELEALTGKDLSVWRDA